MIGFDPKYHGFYPVSNLRKKLGLIKAETVKLFLCVCKEHANFWRSFASNSLESTYFNENV